MKFDYKGKTIELKKASRFARGSNNVFLNGKLIGKVERIRWTSGSATEWKATGEYTSKGYSTAREAAIAIIETEHLITE